MESANGMTASIEPTKESLERQVKEAREKISALEASNAVLKIQLDDATVDAAKMADKASKAKSEMVNMLARGSKDKESLVQQVQGFREQIKNFEKSERIATMARFSKYIASNGKATDQVPAEVRGEDDWIGALAASHKALIDFRKAGKWGGMPEAHATLPDPDMGCSCPVCVLRREVLQLRNVENASLMQKLKDQEAENKVLKDENREHHRAAGPASEKTRAKLAAEAKELADAREAADKSGRDLLAAKKRLQEAEADLERERAKTRKVKNGKPAAVEATSA